MLEERLRIADIKKRHNRIGSIGALYSGYDMNNGNAVASAGFVYMARRAIICTLIFVVISNNSLIPLIIILFLQIFYTMYLCQFRPYEIIGDNKLEIVNESLALYMLYFFQCLNNPAVPIISRSYISWGMLSMAAVLVIYNATLIGAAVATEIFDSLKQCYYKHTNKLKAYCGKKHPEFSSKVDACCT